MCSKRYVCERAAREAYALWLLSNVSREDLAARVARVFREKGPALPALLRRDLEWFLEDRPARTLAECAALNEDPAACEEFTAWLREPLDPHAIAGVAPGDFCEDKGPGGT